MKFLRDFSGVLQKKEKVCASATHVFFCELSIVRKEVKNRNISTNRPGHGSKTAPVPDKPGRMVSLNRGNFWYVTSKVF